jgi:GNAT superfamily N-acetyltransferase
VVKKSYLAALRTIHRRLCDASIEWVVTGSLGMALQGMSVEVHDIDLQTDEIGAYEIEKRLADYIIRPVRYVASERIRSHFGRLEIEGVKVEIMGALQKWLDGQGWEKPVDVTQYRRLVEVEGMSVPALSLAYEQQAYEQLGRLDKAEAIQRWLEKRLTIEPFRPEDQQPAKALILAGMEEHWGVLDESKNPELDDIASSYADGVFLVARQGDEMVGTGAFRPVSDGAVEIVRMSVKKEKRRQGIGREILAELCWRAYRRGYKRTILETTASWEEVVAFYRAFGFEVTHHVAGDVYFAMELQEFIEREHTTQSGG